MKSIEIIERELSETELERIWTGFVENELKHTQTHQTSDRIGFVVLDEQNVIGCATGLAYKNGEEYTGWFYLTDLFIEENYRRNGYGKNVLLKLENKLISMGIKYIWAWTAGFEATGFYKKLGYTQYAELENYYRNGYSRIALRKNLV